MIWFVMLPLAAMVLVAVALAVSVRRRPGTDRWWLFITMLVLAAAVVIGVGVVTISEIGDRDRKCAEAGGHILHHICVSPDGRVLDI